MSEVLMSSAVNGFISRVFLTRRPFAADTFREPKIVPGAMAANS